MLTESLLTFLRDPPNAVLPECPADPAAWLLLLSAANYCRPDLVGEPALRRLSGFLRAPEHCRLAGDVTKQLHFHPHVPYLVEALFQIISEAGHPEIVYEAAIASLREIAGWSRWLPDADALLALAAVNHLQERREEIAAILERPLIAREPPCLSGAFSKYCHYYLYGKAGLAPEVRKAFTLHECVERRLGRGRRRILIVHNIDDGQGDEMVRTVPLMQALLDFNAHLEIVAVTHRVYLYAHPRVHAISIHDSERTEAQLRENFDGVIDFFETNVKEVNYDRGFEERLQGRARERRPFLFLCSTKGYNHFLFETAEIDGEALPLGLNRLRIPNNYETTCRLIAELGLPYRRGEQMPLSENVLAGVPWQEPETAWTALTMRNRGQRPVALLSPFGGRDPLKGFLRPEGTAAELRRLAGQGFFVVLMPNGTPNGGARAARDAVSLLAPAEQACVEIASDPAGEAAHADHVMRLGAYFVRFADLVVTVEGWMMHAAYLLGKPYRVLMLAYSHPAEWHPYCPSGHQTVYPAASPQDPPEQPRKFALLYLLRELGDRGIVESFSFLMQAAQSPDRHVRLAAIRSIGRFHSPQADSYLTALLCDPSHEVRAAAAGALIARSTAEPALELQLHQWIGQDDRDWIRIEAVGEPARPVIELAARGDDPVIRKEAAIALRILDFRAARAGRRSRPMRLLARVLGR